MLVNGVKMDDFQQPIQSSDNEKLGFLSAWKGTVAGVGAAVVVLAGGYGLVYQTGFSDAGKADQKEISELREKLATQISTTTINEGRLADLQSQMKQWQDAYKAQLVENSALKEQLKQLDPCAYIESELNALAPYSDAESKERRSRMQEQLSTCKH